MRDFARTMVVARSTLSIHRDGDLTDFGAFVIGMAVVALALILIGTNVA